MHSAFTINYNYVRVRLETKWAHTMRLVWSVVRILADDHHFDLQSIVYYYTVQPNGSPSRDESENAVGYE